MDKYSHLGNSDPAAIETLFTLYKNNPQSIDKSWQNFFEGFEFANAAYGEKSGVSPESKELFKKEINVTNLIGAYRNRGHLFTQTNPVRQRRIYAPPIDYKLFGLSDSDLDLNFHAGSRIGIGFDSLRLIIERMEQTYCKSVGVEYKFIRDPDKIEWLQNKMESCQNTPNFTKEQKQNIFTKLNHAVAFEKYMHTKFVGQKRFSMEGAESMIPALEAIIETGSELGIKEFVIGMAHRGRLNVLANIMGKPYERIFSEFEGKGYERQPFGGDVKYHMGYSSDRTTTNGEKVHLSMPPNPSHLEAVDPVVEGIVRAKIDHRYQSDLKKIAPILIHGDASIAGQGIVYEVLQMSTLDGYKTGGTIHVVLNNQVGFTTDYLDARSSTYCTDIAKVTLSPVFHVNADDAEAVVHVIQLALRFRQEYHTDVFIDILGYRKHGHNEGDDPRFTQPKLYENIANHKSPVEIYQEKLISQGDLTGEEIEYIKSTFLKELDDHLERSKIEEKEPLNSFSEGDWKGINLSSEDAFQSSPDTGAPLETLKDITDKITTLEKNKFFSKIVKIFGQRRAMVFEKGLMDWAIAEHLAYGTLLCDGFPIRFSGQDVERGTFSHRHAVLKIPESEEEYVPLNHISENQEKFEIYNSHLSEYGVLGFEYGYSMATPQGLTIWEAQFGDFSNGAQIIIDQFITAGETKWQRMNGIVLLLPHGYEGQGPEHSSARLERFLTMCAEDNIQVSNCTTPANFFHILRRQMHRNFRKPLILMSPKVLLRHPKCVSELKEFDSGTTFQELIDDTKVNPESVIRILLCSGKMYYDLLEKQQEEQIENVAILRMELLYPVPMKQIEEAKNKYSHAKEWIWVQEEPENMGAWPFILRKLNHLSIRSISRKESSATATGFISIHKQTQSEIVQKAFEF